MKPISYHIAPYLVEIYESQNLNELEHDWSQLQSKLTVPFFLTWNWISCWLNTYKPNTIVVKATFNHNLVAIGLFTRSMLTRRGFITSNQILLHQMGDPLKDQIWMEYNDFLALEKHKTQAVNACLKALDEDPHWDETVISMMSSKRALQVAQSNPYTVLDQYRPCYSVNLDSVRLSGKEYIELLTPNTRYQIRRSMRMYEKKYGALKLITADNQDQALQFFNQAGPYHIRRWKDSGYLNPQFVRFHENLITNSYQHDAIRVLKIIAGEVTIAVMYYHIVNKAVYFYLQGLHYEINQKFKPGLVAHSLATQYFIDQGMTAYDYMGGYSQYKEQLADLSDNLVTVVIQRPRSRFKLENMARDIKNRIIAPNS